MKGFKLLLTILIITLVTNQTVNAKTARVEALDNYNTANDTLSLSFNLLNTINVDDKLMLYEGSVFYAETYKIKDPKRLKQNASFILKKVMKYS